MSYFDVTMIKRGTRGGSLHVVSLSDVTQVPVRSHRTVTSIVALMLTALKSVLITLGLHYIQLKFPPLFSKVIRFSLSEQE
jgi:hypothetical protein